MYRKRQTNEWNWENCWVQKEGSPDQMVVQVQVCPPRQIFFVQRLGITGFLFNFFGGNTTGSKPKPIISPKKTLSLIIMTPTHQVYELLSSTRFDPFLLTLRWNDDEDGPSDFLLLRYHFDRLTAAAECHDWDQAKSSLTSYDEFKTLCQNAVAKDNKNGPGALKVNQSKHDPWSK